jgi:hypothetical protein
MRSSRWPKTPVFLLAISAAACATAEEEVLAPTDVEVDDVPADDPHELAEAAGEARMALRPASLRIPTTFRASCEAIRNAPEPPADLTINQFFACLTEDSNQKLAEAYQKKAARLGRGPADLPTFLAEHGEKRVAETRLRDLAWGSAEREGRADGVAPAGTTRLLGNSSGEWGLDPSTCGKSCLSMRVGVLGGTRTMGISPAWTGAEAGPTDGRRLLDEVNPGAFPNYDQDDLASSELRAAGCGPVSAVNLFEWWNIPVYNGATKLTSFDSRTNYIAGRMDTLEGINFTDDEELIDFVTQYPKQLYEAGRTSGYPGYHYMVDKQEGWKVMMNYVSRGYPVIVLYASGSASMHWAVIAGYTGGNLRIANAPNLTLSQFYDEWHHWGSLDWYAAWASDVYVDKDTFVALTGWGNDGSPAPERFTSRSPGVAPAGYQSGGNAYAFRYCVGGWEAEKDDVSGWSDPAWATPGYCLYTKPQAGFSLSPSPSGGAASSGYNGTVSLSVAATSALTTFTSNNPGARCEFRGYDGSAWSTLQSRRCVTSGARAYSFTNTGRWKKVVFTVHSGELARTTWNISVN